MKTKYIQEKKSRVLGVSGKFIGACDIEVEVICVTPLYGTQGHISTPPRALTDEAEQ